MSKEVVGCCSRPAGEKDMVGIVIQNDVANTCSEDEKQWLKSLMGVQRNNTSGMKKVPPMLRENKASRKCYDPLVVSVGPYHHGEPKLQLMEEHKYIMACKYADKNKQKLEELYTKVKSVSKDAEKYYIDDYQVKDKDFTQMMFLDGCFVLQFISCYAENSLPDLEIKGSIAAKVLRDLYLLENQLPFLVLKELMNLTINEKKWKTSFSNFIRKILGPSLKSSHARAQDQFIIDFNYEHAHLLDVIRTQLIGTPEKDPNDCGWPSAKLLDFITKQLICTPKKQSPPAPKHGGWLSYRSAKELKAVGIHFGPSNTRKFTDVTFKSFFVAGFLTLPPLKVDDYTKDMLLNMVAYEESLDDRHEFSVSSYICFIDSLIDHAEDVKELRSKGILVNFLGSDEQVAQLFNQIADNLVPNQNDYAKVKGQIEKHYNKKINIWLADWIHTHFTSPWTFLAFVGAIFALFLTVIQTYVSVYKEK